MALDSAAREAAKVWFMRRWGTQITKADLRSAVDATDVWIDNNSASFNTALPSAAQTGLDAGEKTALFCLVALRRAGFLEVS